MDALDRLPDPLVVDILNKVGDVKTLTRCRSASKRLNSLVPQVDSLLLRLDQVLSPESESEFDSPVVNFFRSLFKSLGDLFKLFPKPADPTRINLTRSQCDPARILTRFDQIRRLEVELPGGDMKLEKGAIVKWKAEFGKTLRSCVIVAFRSVTVSAPVTEYSGTGSGAGESDSEFVSGLKTRVVWTISALLAASARHYLMREVVKEREEMERLVVRDREGDGTVVMEAEGLREYRETEALGEDEGEERVGEVQDRGRTVVPSVKMSMRHAHQLRLKSGICLEGATLVVVRPSGKISDDGDAELAAAAFGGGGDCMYEEVVAALLKCRRNVLEMNSF